MEPKKLTSNSANMNPNTEGPRMDEGAAAAGGATHAQGGNRDAGHPPLDLASMRLTQSFDALTGVKKLLATVPARKPNRQEFFRVHRGENFRMPAAVLEIRDERETYILDMAVARELPGEWVPRELVTAITRQDVVFVWPVPLPGPDGRTNSWHESARAAALRAQTEWVRMAANMALGAYDIYVAPGDLPDPQWPSEDFQTLLSIAYRDKVIRDLDHPVLRRLRGEL